MDQLNSMRQFVEVVKVMSFSAAADTLGLSRAQISKSVMQLEAHLGSRLLNRTTRRISLTDEGRVYYERCLTILDDIDELEASTGEQNRVPKGRLLIAAPTSFGILHLQPALVAFQEAFPDVQVSLSLSDRFIDVVKEGFDVVIRIAELGDSSLIARKLAPCKRVFCASPGYLAQYGVPQRPQDLTDHQCLVFSNELKPDSWRIYGPQGIETINVTGPICADNGDILKAYAIQGMGVTLLPSFTISEELKRGNLVPVLNGYGPPDISVYAVFPSRRFLSAKVRSFIDHLTQAFSEPPYWDDYST
jgi:DNA-binding transcriptional LysR family regulator